MKKKKVLIITLPLRLNYGGILQAYALQKIVEGLGFEVFTDNAFFLRTLSLKEKLKDFLARFICGCIKGDDKYKPLIKKRLKRKDYEKVAKNILPFIAENIKTIDFFEGKRYPKQKNTENFDIFICGSDQVWRRKYADVRRYFFDFLNGTGKIRFSYSASFGIDDLSEYSLKEKQDCKQLIKTFSAISVREKQAMEIIKTEFDQEAVLTLDPTLLLTKEDYINLINKRDPSLYVNENENLFVYVLDKTTEQKPTTSQVKPSTMRDNAPKRLEKPFFKRYRPKRNLSEC